MTPQEQYELLAETYIALLMHPYDEWRMENQRVYCNVRLMLSELSGSSEQEIQDMFESQVALIRATSNITRG